MNPERWRRINEVFHATLETPAAARGTFLDHACAGDAGLRAEVESLLAFHEGSPGFLESPAAQVAAPLLSGSPLSGQPDELAPGARVGPYVVLSEVGRGGMGVVYLAEDTRLGRKVALKALDPSVLADEQRRARLRQEARAAAALSHPGIATVYALEEVGDRLYIASEFIAGQTLRADLENGPLRLEPLLDVAIGVADALAAAHDQGIVHRDLKPENVIRADDGRVTILDFGLALIQPSAGELAAAPARLTRAGAIIGTPGYMSPEQLRGQELDARTDLFSLGILLYELASGRHPFAGSDWASTAARILEREPEPLSWLDATVEPRLEAIIRRCLRKVRRERYGAAREILRDLEQLRRDLHDAPLAARLPSSGREFTMPMRVTPRWWWQFHQVSAALAYWLMVWPAWKAREAAPVPWGTALFFAVLAAVVVAANLRLHLWFTSRYSPDSLAAQRRRVAPWVRGADWAFSAGLALGAAGMVGAAPALATLFAAVSIGSLLVCLVIEPATAKAAFRRSPRAAGRKTPARGDEGEPSPDGH